MNGFVIGDNRLAKKTKDFFGIKDSYPPMSLREGLTRRFVFICFEDVEKIKEIAKQIHELGFNPITIIRADGYPGFTQSLKDKYGIEFIHSPNLSGKLVVIGGTGNLQVVNTVKELFKDCESEMLCVTSTESEYITTAYRILK